MTLKLKAALLLSIASLVPAVLSTCSPSSISGATDTETGCTIAGIVLDKNGMGVAAVPVTLIPDSYDPLRDEPLPDLFTTVTDTEGRYIFRVENSGTFNISGRRDSDQSCFLNKGIVFDPSETVRDTGVLTPPGFLMVQLPDTVDTNRGYLYFKGTQIVAELYKEINTLVGRYSLIFDALPTSSMPPLCYSQFGSGGSGTELVSSITVGESDSIVLETTTLQVKPLWRFSLLVGIKSIVRAHFGSLEQIAPRITSQLAATSKKLNATNLFNGVFLFVADSIYEYYGTVAEEDEKPLYRFNYRLLYDDMDQPVVLHEIKRTKYIYIWAYPIDSLFGNICNRYLINLCGELRGAFNLSWANVDGFRNYVNYSGFTAVPSVMHNPAIYSSNAWDDYSVSVINYNTGTIGTERDILHKAFPDTMGISVTMTSGLPMSGVYLRVYGSVLNTQTVTADTICTGTTDENGIFRFPFNPFVSKNTGELQYGNLLITINSNFYSGYTWFPVYEAGNAYFNDPSVPYYKTINF